MARRNMAQIHERRRQRFNSEFAKLTRGKSMTQKRKNALMRKLWKKVKREIK